MGISIVFSNVLMMIAYLGCGLALVKGHKAEPGHAKSFSGFLLYVCCPCMIISAFQSMEYSMENIKKAVLFFFVSMMVQLLFFFALFLLFRKKYTDAKYRILTIGAILGNVGFFGLPVATSLFPNEPIVACYSTLYVTSMNILVFTVGIFMITNDKKHIAPKAALLNPPILSVVAAVPLYLLQIHFPTQIGTAIALLGKMTTPICMLILGMRLAAVSLKKVFTRPFSYAVCLFKLIIFPLFAYLCVYFLPCIDSTFKITLFVLSAAPSASVILSLAELHECEQELSANVVLITTLLSLITISLLLLIV